MSKRISVIIAMVLVLSLASGCSIARSASKKNESTKDKSQTENVTSGTSSKVEDVEPEISLTLPEGWEKKESTTLGHYMKGTASVIITSDVIPYEMKNLADYAKAAEDQFKDVFEDVKFGSIEKITVNGLDGCEMTFTGSMSGMDMKYRIVYLAKDSTVFILTCGDFKDSYDDVAADFDKIIESIRVK